MDPTVQLPGAAGPLALSNSATSLAAPAALASRAQRLDPFSSALRLLHVAVDGTVESFANIAGNLAERLAPRSREPFDAPLTGKVALVTGGNAGIGFATAQQLARRGAHVVLACRDSGRAQQAAEEIRRTPLLALPPSSTSTSPTSPSPALCSCESLPVPLDLSRLSSVRSFAACWAARGLPLHLLVCNAGVMGPPDRRASADGHELQFQVNFLSHWLLANLLLQHERGRRAKAQAAAPALAAAGPKGGSGKPAALRLQAGAGRTAALGSITSGLTYTAEGRGGDGILAGGGPANSGTAASWDKDGGHYGLAGGGAGSGDGCRVVVVTSLTHRAGMLQWADKQSAASYEPFLSYALSKLANVMTAVELQRRMGSSSPDTAVAVHPGLVSTGLANGFFNSRFTDWAARTPLQGPVEGAVRLFGDVVGPLLMRSPQQSADVMLHACLAPREQVAGRYLALGRPARPDAAAEDPALRSELWDYASSLTGCQGLPPHAQ